MNPSKEYTDFAQDFAIINILRRLRRKIRREAGPYSQVSAAQVVEWIDEEIKRRKV